MAAKATDLTPENVECEVLRGRIMLDGKIYAKGDMISLPAEKVDTHPVGMIQRK